MEILSPDGDILHSTSYLKEEKPSIPAGINDNNLEINTGRPVSKKSGKIAKQNAEEVVSTQPCNTTVETKEGPLVDWLIISSNGEQKMIKSNGDKEDLDSLFVSNATCFETNQVLFLIHEFIFSNFSQLFLKAKKNVYLKYFS